MDDAGEATAPAARQSATFLTFKLAGELFAIAVTSVNEIIDVIATTPVPGADPFAPALINVRGAVAPLVDVRERLRMPSGDMDGEARIIVLELPIAGESTRLGLLAEGVESVRDVALDLVDTMPELGARWPAEFIDGVAKLGDDLVILLNVETLFSPTV
ncbi:MAG: chemotaxis protein CheW [Pseudomonadota bacterium]